MDKYDTQARMLFNEWEHSVEFCDAVAKALRKAADEAYMAGYDKAVENRTPARRRRSIPHRRAF